MIREQELALARQYAESGQMDKAYPIASRWLIENPNDIVALVVMTFILRKTRKLPEAYHISKKVTELSPNESAAWINHGQICNELFRSEDAERSYKRGLSITKDPDAKAMLLTNLAALHIDLGRFDEAQKEAEQAIELKPQSGAARSNLGFCQLAKKDWANGWKNYRICLGTESRKRMVYKDPPEPEWHGEEGKRVVLCGEQGLGDEIAFASMVPDAIERASQVIMDIDERLEGLFKRSFPKAHVYGTRMATADSGKRWAPEDRLFDCSIAIAQLGEFFRLKDSDFPATPYLVACPDRKAMWKALFSNKGKPVIGLAWTGGTWQTGGKFRNLKLEQFLPIMQSIDAHWVCLQYKDSSQEISEFKKRHPEMDIAQYPYATLTRDYDDTAALVAALDLVISVPTACVHLAAALGTPVIAMNSPHRCWKFYAGLPMHPMVDLVPNTGWDKTIMEAARRMSAKFQKAEAA